VYDENKVGQCLVAVHTLTLPTLLKQVVELIPLLELEYCFKLKLDDLKEFRANVGLSGAAEVVDVFGSSNTAELLAMLASFEIVL
jgi:hypothetical protein